MGALTTCAAPGLQIERKRKKALPLSRPILTRLAVLGMLGIFFWQVSSMQHVSPQAVAMLGVFFWLVEQHVACPSLGWGNTP